MAPSRMAQSLLSVPGTASHPDWPHAETQRGAGPLHIVPLAGSQRRGRCSRRDYTKPYCRGPEGFPARAGTRASPSTAGQMAQPGRTRPHPPQDALQRMLPMQPLSPPLVPSRAAPLPAALLGGLCHPAAEVLMVLCPALNYFPDCHRHVLASGAGCDPAEPDAAAAAWGANGRSTPHVEFNYWLSSLTEYIG